MTSVNSPACLLARNHFHTNSTPSPKQLKSVISCQVNRHQQRRLTVHVTMASPAGGSGTKRLLVKIVLGSIFLRFPTSKPTRPANRSVK